MHTSTHITIHTNNIINKIKMHTVSMRHTLIHIYNVYIYNKEKDTHIYDNFDDYVKNIFL